MRFSRTSIFHVILLVLFAIALALRIQNLRIMPLDWDENYYLNIGSNFIERGGLTPYMWRLDADTNIIAGSGTGYGVLLLNFWLKYVDFSFISGRVLMLILNTMTVVLMYGLARVWWGSHLAGMASAIVAISLSSSFITVYMRMDTPGIFTYTVVLLLHILAVRRQKLWLHFLTGITAVVAAEFHILATLTIGALAVYYVVETIISLWKQQHKNLFLLPIFWFGLGGLLAGIIYIVVHILPDPEAYFIISDTCYYCKPASLFKEWERYSNYFTARPVEMVTGSLFILLALVRFRPADRHYLVLLGGLILALGIISPPTQTRYIAHGWIWIALGAGGIFTINMVFVERWFLRELVVIGIVTMLLFGQWQRFDDYSNPTSFIALPEQRARAVRMNFPRDTVILGYVPFYADFTEYPLFLSYQSGEQYGMRLRGEDYPTLLEREHPEVLIAHVERIPILLAYAQRHDFIQVMESLWIHPDLCKELIGCSG